MGALGVAGPPLRHHWRVGELGQRTRSRIGACSGGGDRTASRGVVQASQRRDSSAERSFCPLRARRADGQPFLARAELGPRDGVSRVSRVRPVQGEALDCLGACVRRPDARRRRLAGVGRAAALAGHVYGALRPAGGQPDVWSRLG